MKLNLPETGNGTPDMLNEIRWNLEWMLTMQDEDGGVWHKQTSERFPGFVMPETGQAGELRGRQRSGAVQDVVRHRRPGGGDGDCGPRVQAVRRGIRGNAICTLLKRRGRGWGSIRM